MYPFYIRTTSAPRIHTLSVPYMHRIRTVSVAYMQPFPYRDHPELPPDTGIFTTICAGSMNGPSDCYVFINPCYYLAISFKTDTPPRAPRVSPRH